MSTLRVLLAEDDALIGMLLAEILEDMGHDICAIEATESEAVTAAARWQPDLMIIDAHLGNGSGIAAVQDILRTGFIPHVFVSGDPSCIEQHMPGAVIVQKPFREADLASAIRRALAVAAA